VPGNLVFIGFSGTGKSTVSRLVAERLDWPWVDTDQQIVRDAGKSIAQIFQEEGEAAFRRAEAEAVAAACRGHRQVISVGGGAPVHPALRQAIQKDNLVVRLDAAPTEILRRLTAGADAEERPMLADADRLVRITRLLAARADAYAIADLAIDTMSRSPEDVAEAVLRALPAGWVTARAAPEFPVGAEE
jgi:shikimate kinase